MAVGGGVTVAEVEGLCVPPLSVAVPRLTECVSFAVHEVVEEAECVPERVRSWVTVMLADAVGEKADRESVALADFVAEGLSVAVGGGVTVAEVEGLCVPPLRVMLRECVGVAVHEVVKEGECVPERVPSWVTVMLADAVGEKADRERVALADAVGRTDTLFVKLTD